VERRQVRRHASLCRARPVAVGGVTIKLATLHNEEDLLAQGHPCGGGGDRLRAGDVIPQVVSPAPHVVEQEGRPPQPHPPSVAPSATPDGEADRQRLSDVPPTASARARVAAVEALRLTGAMDNRGLVRAVALLQERDCSERRGLLTAERRAARPVEGSASFGEQSPRRDRGVEGAPLRTRAVSRRDRGVGESRVRNLAQRFRDIDAAAVASPAESRDAGVGEKMALLIRSQLADPTHAEPDRRLRKIGLRFHERTAAVRGPLGGQDARAHREPAEWSRGSAQRIMAAGAA